MRSILQKTYGLFLFSIFLFMSHQLVFGQIVEAWNIHYDSPYGGVGDHDWVYDIAVDEDGNSYVTGWSAGRLWSSTNEHDFVTIKYDPEGNELWVARDDTTSHGGAYAIALDRDANVYVTGFISGAYAHDYLTIKYDTDGNELWSARWQGVTDNDVANAIAVDDEGNVYVTGRSESFGTETDYLTIKYDTDGNELWVARYDGPAQPISSDTAYDIAVDAVGNVYVTGRSLADDTGNDYLTIKYDTDGNELWVARYDGPASGLDEPAAIAVNSAGEVFVTGKADSNYNDSNYTTVKYDSDGNELWVAYYAEGFRGNMPAAMAIDAASNVYVTGWSDGRTTDDDFATVKYDTDGNELWVARYDGVNLRDQACDIAVDINGSVAVTGWSKFGDIYYERDIVTIKYDANGNELWFQRYDAAGRYDEANAIAMDREGNVCVTGWSDTGNANEFTTIKYVPTVSLGFTCLTPFVKRGESLQYEATLANNTSEYQDFWAWIKAKLPTGEWYEDFLLPPTNLSLVPDETMTFSVSQRIPFSALQGRYEYWGYIGSDTLAVWDCDMFPFSVYFHPHHHEVND